MTCARCGCGVYEAENQITLNKIWHKCCFCCRNCNTKLDKCTAKVFRGDIFCENCYENILEELEKLSQPCCRPCRVVSSPSCICLRKEENQRKTPPFDYCKKYNICFPPERKKAKPARISQSCSCLRDAEKTNQSFCFAFPIPREVANYYNRANMRKNKAQYCKTPTCCPNENSGGMPRNACIRVRTISPPSKKCPAPVRCRSPSPKPRKYCCCSRCRPPAAPPSPYPMNCPPSCPNRPPSCPANRPPSCPANRPPCCPANGPPSCPTECPPSRSDGQCCCCCCNAMPRCRSPPRRPQSPARRCPPRPAAPRPCSCSGERQQECPPKQQQQQPCSCDNWGRAEARQESRPPQRACCAAEKSANKYCSCGRPNPCKCKMSQIRAICTSVCNRCGHKVYAAEKISVSSGPYHTSCFSCYCCHKLLDVKNVFEHCDEIYCKSCYNTFFGISYYGYGSYQYS